MIGVSCARNRCRSARGVDCLVLMSSSGAGSGDAASCSVEKAGVDDDGSSESDPAAACSSSDSGGGRQNCWKTAWIWVASSL